jgi:hypothetical protein
VVTPALQKLDNTHAQITRHADIGKTNRQSANTPGLELAFWRIGG